MLTRITNGNYLLTHFVVGGLLVAIEHCSVVLHRDEVVQNMGTCTSGMCSSGVQSVLTEVAKTAVDPQQVMLISGHVKLLLLLRMPCGLPTPRRPLLPAILDKAYGRQRLLSISCR